MIFQDGQEFTAHIKARAAVAGVTLSQIFAESGVSPDTWSAWKRGKSSPTLRSINRVESALAAMERASGGKEW